MLRFLRAGRPGFPRSSIERWRDAATDFVFPPRCAVCDAGGSLLCDDCRAGFTRAAPPRCPRCHQRRGRLRPLPPGPPPAPDLAGCLHL